MAMIPFFKIAISHHASKFVVVILAIVCYAQTAQSKDASDTSINQEIVFSGPNQKDCPTKSVDPGFWSFAISVPNVLSRSGQLSMAGFQWLKDNGWKSIVDLRLEYDDVTMEGFNELGFNYLRLPIVDGSVPTEQQAQEFLGFATTPSNQPVYVHCYAGVGRTGIMVALYRYMVQGWRMDKAISESRLFGGGVNNVQENWLKGWAQRHNPGSQDNAMRL